MTATHFDSLFESFLTTLLVGIISFYSAELIVSLVYLFSRGLYNLFNYLTRPSSEYKVYVSVVPLYYTNQYHDKWLLDQCDQMIKKLNTYKVVDDVTVDDSEC